MQALLPTIGVDVNKRIVTTEINSLPEGTIFGNNMTSYTYFLTLLLATSWLILIFGTLECKFQTFSLRFFC